MLIIRSPRRLPTSKSLKSCAGVIFTAPVPFSGSAYSSATMAMSRRVELALAPPPLERAVAFDLHDFEVRDRRLEFRVPIDEAFVLVDQPFAIKLHEDFQHRLRQALVHRETLARPVAGSAEALQ